MPNPSKLLKNPSQIHQKSMQNPPRILSGEAPVRSWVLPGAIWGGADAIQGASWGDLGSFIATRTVQDRFLTDFYPFDIGLGTENGGPEGLRIDGKSKKKSVFLRYRCDIAILLDF